jgi:hypothetical protein
MGKAAKVPTQTALGRYDVKTIDLSTNPSSQNNNNIPIKFLLDFFLTKAALQIHILVATRGQKLSINLFGGLSSDPRPYC